MAMPPMLFATNYGRGLSGSDDGLGFSLRPPKFVRKAARAVKRNITLKRVLIGGAIVGAAFIPGVAPAAMSLARGAGKYGVRAIKGTGRLVGKGARGIFGRKRKDVNKPGDDPTDTDSMDRPSGAPPGAADRSPGPFGPPPGDYSPAAPGASSAGGGGGGGGPVPSGAEPPDATEASATMTQPNGPGGFSAASLAVPAMIGLGAIALLSMNRHKARR
jgi:hypothetical protein